MGCRENRPTFYERHTFFPKQGLLLLRGGVRARTFSWAPVSSRVLPVSSRVYVLPWHPVSSVCPPCVLLVSSRVLLVSWTPCVLLLTSCVLPLSCRVLPCHPCVLPCSPCVLRCPPVSFRVFSYPLCPPVSSLCPPISSQCHSLLNRRGKMLPPVVLLLGLRRPARFDPAVLGRSARMSERGRTRPPDRMHARGVPSNVSVSL